MKYQVCFHAKNKKKILSLHLLQQNFFTVKWFGISLGFTVYIIREHYMTAWRKEILILMLS